MRQISLCLLVAALLCLFHPASAVQVNPSFETHLWGTTRNASRWHILRTLYVSVNSPRAFDTNPGTQAAPLKTIQRAVTLAKPGTRILIAPGIYREIVKMGKPNSGTALEPVILEAEKPGTVILSGSDRWTGWQPEATPGVYSHAWPYKWGVGPDIFGAAAPMQPLGRRSEMVFVNGTWYRQVLDRARMQPGTFWVSDGTAQILLQASRGTDISHADVEVAVRRQAVDMGSVWGSLNAPHDWPSYYVLSGLTVQHYTSQGEFTLPAICGYGAHFLIEDCSASWNNGTGLELRGTDIIVRHCRFDHDGFSGISIPPTPFPAVQDVLLGDDVVAHDNWRGALGDFYGYAVAGMKMMTSGSVILRNFVSRDNASPGVWFDNQNRNILIEDSKFLHNRAPGLWMEISQGPFLVRRCLFAFNEAGARISNSAQITLSQDTFYGNGAQIDEWSPALDRGGFYDAGLTLQDSVLACANDTQALWRRPDYPNITETLTSRGNLWWRPDGAGWEVGSDDLDFSQWILLTHQDTDSLLADPRLRAPQSGIFTPRPTSPWHHKATWGKRSVVCILPPGGLAAADTQVYLSAFGTAGPIHYTLNGQNPTLASPIYAGPFPLPKGGTVRATVLDPGSHNPVASARLVGGAPPPPDIPISTLTPTKDVVGWGGFAHTNLSIQGQPLHVAGLSFSDGMGAHAPSELDYRIPAGVARFVSVVGLDDEVLGQGAHPAVRFAVSADDTLLAKTNVLTLGQIRFINVALPPTAKILRLMVTRGGPTQDWDHADWIRAGFLKTP